MLKTIHRYNRSFTLVIFLSVACFALTGIGLDILRQSSRGQHAIKVGDVEVGYEEFQRERRNFEERSRQQYGPQYATLLQAMGINLSQVTVDKIIDSALLGNLAQSLGMHVGRADIASAIKNRIFGGQFSPALYEQFLGQSGQTSRQFESRLKKDLLADSIRLIVSDIAFPSVSEVRARMIRDDTSFDVEYVDFDVKSFESSVPEPGQTELRAYYQAHPDEFFIPERVVYDYVVFDPTSFEPTVIISPEAVQHYYDQHKARFSSPEEVKVRHIQMQYPKDTPPEKKAEIRKKMEEAHQKVIAGEDFSAIVKLYSDDLATNLSGGDLGWLTKGTKFSKLMLESAFKLKDGGISDVIDAGYGFHILKVEGYRAARPKLLNEVKGEIENSIRKEESPAYAASSALSFFNDWKASYQTLPEYALKMDMTPSSSSGARDSTSDPEDSVKGLTAMILDPSHASESKIRLEMGDRVILVGVTSREAQQQAHFEDVVTKVTDRYRLSAATKLAAKGITVLLESLRSGVQTDLRAAARASRLETKELKGMKRSEPGTGIMADAKVRDAVFAVTKPGTFIPKEFRVGDSSFLVRVAAIEPPKAEIIASKLGEARQSEGAELAQLALQGLLASEKKLTEVDFDKNLLAGN